MYEKITLFFFFIKKITNQSQVYCNYAIMEKWAFYWEKRDLDSHEISKFKYFCKLGCS